MTSSGFDPPTGEGLTGALEYIYGLYHRPQYIHPDPVEFPRGFEDPRDREIVAFVAASLAYGRVSQIHKSVAGAVAPMGKNPRSFIETCTRKGLQETYAGFRHRFTSGNELADLIWALACIIREHGCLEACFMEGYRPSHHEDTTEALGRFVGKLASRMAIRRSSLLPLPEAGSACKRLHLFLRWMVRSDAIDPGGWTGVKPCSLVVPLDAHMFAMGKALGMTRRRQADLKTALEITQALRKVDPDDPLRFDFSLTRLGMRRTAGCSAGDVLVHLKETIP